MSYFLTYRSNGTALHMSIVQYPDVAIKCASLWCETPFLSAEIMDDKGKPLMRVWRSLSGVQMQSMS